MGFDKPGVNGRAYSIDGAIGCVSGRERAVITNSEDISTVNRNSAVRNDPVPLVHSHDVGIPN